MTKRIRMLSQIKRKKNLFLALTLTVLFTGSILAFSIQAAYSAEDYNSSRSNTQTSIAQIDEVLDELKAYAKISGDTNMISYIEILSMDLQQVKQGLVEMNMFHSSLEAELQFLKQTLTSTASKPAVESTASELQKLQSENESLRSEKNSLATELQQLKQQLQSESESATKESAGTTIRKGVGEIEIEIKTEDATIGSSGELEKIGIAKAVDMFLRVGSAFDKTVSLENKVVIVIDNSILGDEMSGKFVEYLKVTLSDARIASIVENERTGISGLGQDDLLTKAAVAPELQPKDIKSKVPPWVRNNAGWYAEGLITEVEFVKGLEWMINNGVIEIQNQEEIVKK